MASIKDLYEATSGGLTWAQLQRQHPDLAKQLDPNTVAAPEELTFHISPDGKSLYGAADRNPGTSIALKDGEVYFQELGWENGDGSKNIASEVEELMP